MNTPVVALLPSTLGEVKKKRVLLVDASHSKRDLRAEVMRKLGIDVDCACDIAEARSWWRADLYDLVLINMEKGLGHRDRFCEDIRGATPPQRLAFLVGEPEYLGEAPNAEDELLIDNTTDPFQVGHVKAALSANVGDLSQRWGILEATRRISAVRSACSARSRAMQDRPVPLRDSEGRLSKKTAASIVLENLLRGEMQ
jgi:DNA-binding NtrC family response regulator